MATKSISQLDTQATANETDLFEVAIVDANSASGYASKKESAAAIADAIVGEYQYPLRITGTTAKTIAGAINELKNLVDLLPQFAIEVVQTLPVSDISETTIYLVPASDPEQGNYYEEYIYVNNAWELVGTTAVDLSGYYTSAQVDTLLAAKADSASLATVATSGAYSDLSGKPTIDTALDTTSTNAVENRAVASEINSIKNDISVDGSASGDIASFSDGADNLPMLSVKTKIEPIQDLHGYDSPWPAGGGKNKFDPSILNDSEMWNYITLTGFVAGASYTMSSPDAPDQSDGNSPRMFFVTTNAAQSTTAVDINHATTNIANENGELKVQFQTRNASYPITSYHFQIEVGSTATSFEPYSNICPISGWTGATINVSDEDTSDPTTYNIDWQDEAGTVYGGTLDVKNGVLSVTHANIASYDGETINEPWISSMDVYVAGTTPTTGAQVVYPLTTPVTYQLTPTEIRSLLGVNNVWADCGAITELKYTRDLNLCINDIIARIEALEGANSSRSLSLSPTLTKSLTSELDTAECKTEEETEEETKEEAQNER